MVSRLSQLAFFLFLTTANAQAAPQPFPDGQCPEKPGWSAPARPAHVFGNSWYVGTCAISSILITSPQGHILIDGATAEAAPSIEANVRALGFRVEDIRYILVSHEHLDHVGGIAHLQGASAASVIAREPAAATLQRGTNDRDDPQFGVLGDFPPVRTIRRIKDGDKLTLGAVTVTAHATPAHTRGSTSWTWESCESGTCHSMAYADSLTAISAEDYRFIDEQAHPGLADRVRKAFKVIADLPCDILMTPHPGASKLLARLGPGANQALVDPAACARYAAQASANFDARLAREQAQERP